MKILVPIKRVIDYKVKIRVKSDGSGVETDNVKMSINPFDENSLEEAIRLREARSADEVIVVSIGPPKTAETLRAGLAMGADRAILVETEENLEPLAVAKILKKIVEEEKPGLVILGKQAIDDDCNQTGQMLAALLNYPQATFAFKLELDDGTASVTREVNVTREVSVTREVDGGLQTIKVKLPAIVTVDLRINNPRFATLPNIMKAKRKPLETRAVADFNVDTAPRLKILNVEEPAERPPGIIVSSVGELVEKLKNEAGVF